MFIPCGGPEVRRFSHMLLDSKLHHPSYVPCLGRQPMLPRPTAIRGTTGAAGQDVAAPSAVAPPPLEPAGPEGGSPQMAARWWLNSTSLETNSYG